MTKMLGFSERHDESIKEWYPQLYRYSCFLSQNKWDGEDIAQEAALKASQQYSAFNAGMLNKIAYHHWIDVIRKKGRETLVAEIPEAQFMDKAMAPDVKMELIETYLKQLTPKQAVIFALKEGFRYQTAEIAEIFSTTETAVKSALFRAKKQLEKRKNCSLPIVSKWDADEERLLTSLLDQAFFLQDPTVLIEAIPRIRSFASGGSNPVSNQAGFSRGYSFARAGQISMPKRNLYSTSPVLFAA